MSVVIIDYGSGNLHSAAKAFQLAASRLSPVPEIMVTANPDLVCRADRIVLPGVGAFADCYKGLLRVDGLLEALRDAVIQQRRPFLGICVGMQLMADEGFEHGRHEGFGWIPGQVKAINPDDPRLKIPHMGWNSLTLTDHTPYHPLLKGIDTGEQGQHAYFVHSYHFVASQPEDVVAVTDYGGPATAMVSRDNLAGTQFHPEKSQKLGLALIENFLTWHP